VSFTPVLIKVALSHLLVDEGPAIKATGCKEARFDVTTNVVRGVVGSKLHSSAKLMQEARMIPPFSAK
jgi:hypothetical protein